METLSETMPITEPTAALEMVLIREYVSEHTPKYPLPSREVEHIWKDALLFAALRLEEIAARAHMLDELHDRPKCM